MSATMTICCCDVLEFDVELIDEDKNPYELDDGDKLWFVVKKTMDDIEELIHIEQSELHFVADTSELELDAGKYKYEIGIIFANGKEKTLAQGTLAINPKMKGHPHG